jgi:hypothetical protein
VSTSLNATQWQWVRITSTEPCHQYHHKRATLSSV